jgi:prolyl 4-hydroxylase
MLACFLRRYTNGSILRMHVDTASTHVVSAIINVDQKGFDSPNSAAINWPVLILDHEYNEHRINMEPGDMLLYESAKLLHGRPGRLEYCWTHSVIVLL